MTDELLKHSAKSRAAFFEKHGQLLQELAEQDQSPATLLISCSDSRIVPEHLLDATPGELFMLRNVANLVPPYWQTEIGFAAVLEYAVQVLQIRHIVILGHTDCGGIHALDESIDMIRQPAMSRWLDLARPAKREVEARFSDLKGQERHQAIVELSALQQLSNLRTYPYVQSGLDSGHLELHVWLYYLEGRELKYFDSLLGEFVFPSSSE